MTTKAKRLFVSSLTLCLAGIVYVTPAQPATTYRANGRVFCGEADMAAQGQFCGIMPNVSLECIDSCPAWGADCCCIVCGGSYIAYGCDAGTAWCPAASYTCLC